MKVICDRADLVDLLNMAGGVVLPRTPKNVLKCVKLSAKDDLLTLMATDMELAIRAGTSKVQIEQAGEVLIQHDKFSQIIRESADPTITLEADEQEVQIRCEDSHFKIFGYSTSDFPPMPQFDEEADFTVTGETLHTLIRQTLFATARENSKYAINGVLLERQGNKLSMVATDGRRLALAKGAAKAVHDQADETQSAIIPSKALTMAVKLFDDPQQEVHLKLAQNQMVFTSLDAVLSTNLVEGTFPPYQDVIPTDSDRKAILDTELLASGVRRASLLTNDESKGVRMAFSAEGLVITSRAPEMGESEINVALTDYQGENITIGFNPFFLSEALKVVPTSEVQFDLKAPGKPGILRAGASFCYVLMPLNLQ